MENECTTSLGDTTIQSTQSRNENTMGESKHKVFKFFWWEACQDKVPGTVYLFGKAFVNETSSFTTCCVSIHNVKKTLYLLPRNHLKSDSTKTVELSHILEEVKQLMKLFQIPKVEVKLIDKKCTFEHKLNEYNKYVQIKYPACCKITKLGEGETFSRSFHENLNCVEILLLERQINGPCWLEVCQTTTSSFRNTFCAIEYKCCDMKHISVSANMSKICPPPMTAVSINIKTEDFPLRRIIAIACGSSAISDLKNISSQMKCFCLITNSNTANFPRDFFTETCSFDQFKIQKLDNERALLQFFLQWFAKLDPDLVIGFNLLGDQLDILHSRLDILELKTYQKLSRLKLNCLPGRLYFNRTGFCGRLLCDVQLSAREFVKSGPYDLQSLSKNILGTDTTYSTRVNVDEIFKTTLSLFRFMNDTVTDLENIFKLLCRFNTLPIILHITEICGCLFSRALVGGRSERNEMLLLNAFYINDYIVPDLRTNNVARDCEENEFKGGIVFTPSPGLHEGFILLVDFVSLYPSIIEEFNVCFTTFELSDLNQVVLPKRHADIGLLPSLIRKLCAERNRIKKQLLIDNHDGKITVHQTALKLTMNSLYGYLAYNKSRFYAKHLAVYIAKKGREILTEAKNLVEAMGYEVIYGDTDSLMIKTNCETYQETVNLAEEIKVRINSLYKVIKLETQVIYKSMLVLKKKKYAGVIIGSDAKLSLETKGIFRSNWPDIVTKCVRSLLDDIFELDTSSTTNEMNQNVEHVEYISTLSTQNVRKKEPNRVSRNDVDDTEKKHLEEPNIATQSSNISARETVLADSNFSKHKRERSNESGTLNKTKRQKIYHSDIKCSSEFIEWIFNGTELEPETENWSQALRSQLGKDYNTQIFHTIESGSVTCNIAHPKTCVEYKKVIKGLMRIKPIVNTSIKTTGQDAVQLFSIAENLSRDPHLYKNTNATHVSVALKLNRSGLKRFKAGDTVRYVICDHSEALAVYERAVHVDDFEGAGLKVDTDYYIHRLIVPSIFSLCKPLGLSEEDVKFHLNVKINKPAVTVQKIDVRNETCETVHKSTKNPFRFKCVTCNFENGMENLIPGKCSNTQCSTRALDNVNHMKNQLQLYVRDLIKRFHYREMTCDNVICGNVTNVVAMKIKGYLPLCYKCEEGNLVLNYTWWDLYSDLIGSRDNFHKTVLDFQTSMHVRDIVAVGSLWRFVDETIATLNEFKVNLSMIFDFVTPKERTNPTFLDDDFDLII